MYTVNIHVDCSEVYPDLEDGAIADRTFTPISATYGCNVGFTGVGSVNRVTCIPGGKWSSLSYRCEPPGKGDIRFSSDLIFYY